jgi:hypothetical protein
MDKVKGYAIAIIGGLMIAALIACATLGVIAIIGDTLRFIIH